MRSVTMLSMQLALASAWQTCEFPQVDWMVVDQGPGKSATQKVIGLGTSALIAGYAGKNVTLVSTKGDAKSSGVPNIASATATDSTKHFDLHLTKIKDGGEIEDIMIFTGEGLGASPGWQVMHSDKAGTKAALATMILGNLTMPKGGVIRNQAKQGSLGVIMLYDNAKSEISWTFELEAKTVGTKTGKGNGNGAAGSYVGGLDVDADGKVYASYTTCVPCTGDDCLPEKDRYGRPTGGKEPICTKNIACIKADGSDFEWGPKELPKNVSAGILRLARVAVGSVEDSLYMWANVKGTEIVVPGGKISSTDADKHSAVLMKFKASDGTIEMAKVVGEAGESFTAGYMDLQPSESDQVLVVAGGVCQTVGRTTTCAETIGGTAVTDYGDLGSYVARLNLDGTFKWAEFHPMNRGVQVTPDGKYVNIFAQTTGITLTHIVNLTDTKGETTMIKSRGSYDLIVAEYDAADGSGRWAIDGGGDNMEYFHGFGMNSEGDILVSGYSRSKNFVFGDKTLPNAADDGLNKIFTIKLNHESTTPSCVSACADNTPVVKPDKCFIDQYCFDKDAFSPYPVNQCFKCDPSTNAWATTPDLTAHCFIDGICYKEGAFKPGASSRSPASTCLKCMVEKSTSKWSQVDKTDLVDGKCVHMDAPNSTVTGAMSDAAKKAMTATDDVKTMTSMKDANGILDWAAIKTDFLKADSVLGTLAKGGWTTSDYTQAKAYFGGSATYMHDYIVSALDATGQFAATMSAARGDMVDARTEAVKKGLQDQVLVMAMLSSVEGNMMLTDNWDLAYAYYHGNTEGSGPYGRANKRCKNYGTCAADGTTAKANFKVMTAIKEGRAAAHAKNSADATAAFQALRTAVYGIYYQASLRYAYFLDRGVAGGAATSDHQGEGGAFWRVIAPAMNAKDADLTAYVSFFYTMDNAPTGGHRYCTLHYLLTNNMLPGYTSTDMGTLEAAEAVKCMAGVQLPQTLLTTNVFGPADGAAAPSSIDRSATTKVKELTGSAGVGTSMAATKDMYTGSILETLAKKNYGSTAAYYTEGAQYFGSPAYLDAYILSALDATGQFAGDLPAANGAMIDARKEAVKKALQDQILVTAAISSIQTTSSQVDAFYNFYAYWAGDTPAGGPWARANKRCKNYGTCGGGTKGADGEKAIINSKILVQVLAGLKNQGGAEAIAARKAKVINLAMMVYYQASLRYAFKLDNDVTNAGATADHQGEGGAFWRVIAPVMHSLDASTTKLVTEFYTMTNIPAGTNHYCPLKRLLHSNLPAGLTLADMGALEGTEAVVCDTPPQAGAPGTAVTTMVITAPGAVSDYVPADVEAQAAKQLGIDPKQVTATISAASAVAGRRLQSDGVIITITVVTSATGQAAMRTAMATMAGTPASASTFLSAATGTTIAVTVAPIADVRPPAAPPPSPVATDPCFPSSALVTKVDGTLTRLDALKKGDAIVATTADGSVTTDTVSALSIAKPTAVSTFIMLAAETGKSLNVTAEHHIPVGASCCSNLLKAKDITVGETVWSVEGGATIARKVTSKTFTTNKGLHSPVLTHGTFPVVNGLVTSVDSMGFVTLASYGLPALLKVCEATNTCGLLRSIMHE